MLWNYSNLTFFALHLCLQQILRHCISLARVQKSLIRGCERGLATIETAGQKETKVDKL